MDLFFLDVVDVVPARSADGPGIDFYLLLAVTILAEAGILYLLRHNLFGKALLHSFAVNAASLAAGFLLIEWIPGLFVPDTLMNLLLLWLITVAIETPLLFLLNRKTAVRTTIKASLVMNLVTYLIFYGYITLFTR
jgi:hypothetical protein